MVRLTEQSSGSGWKPAVAMKTFSFDKYRVTGQTWRQKPVPKLLVAQVIRHTPFVYRKSYEVLRAQTSTKCNCYCCSAAYNTGRPEREPGMMLGPPCLAGTEWWPNVFHPQSL